jgi:hypothetical protein
MYDHPSYIQKIFQDCNVLALRGQLASRSLLLQSQEDPQEFLIWKIWHIVTRHVLSLHQQ